MTSGRWINASSNDLPGKRLRASNQPMAMPNGKLANAATLATRRLRPMAVSSSGEKKDMWVAGGGHSTLKPWRLNISAAAGVSSHRVKAVACGWRLLAIRATG